jgi:hypothetical protein
MLQQLNNGLIDVTIPTRTSTCVRELGERLARYARIAEMLYQLEDRGFRRQQCTPDEINSTKSEHVQSAYSEMVRRWDPTRQAETGWKRSFLVP